MGIACKQARQKHIVNAALIKNTSYEVIAVDTREISSFRSLAYEVHFLQAPKFPGTTDSITSKKTFCLKLFTLVIHHPMLAR